MALTENQPKPGHLRGTSANTTDRKRPDVRENQSKPGYPHEDQGNPTDRKRPEVTGQHERGYVDNEAAASMDVKNSNQMSDPPTIKEA